MSKSIFERRRELYNESLRLRKLSMKVNNYKIQRKIREEQDDLYKRLKFYENYDNACRCMKC